MVKVRKEIDSLGEQELPDQVYYGIQTTRALHNFPVTGIHEPEELITGYVLLKKACALANLELGILDKVEGNAIINAADQVLAGKFIDQFVVDIFQAGAGTSFNMNVNEVLANIALEHLGKRKGEYQHLSPNDHVNMAQSSNDTFPTAAHIAILLANPKFFSVIKELANEFIDKGDQYKDVSKSGRTHLMDAMPVTIGSEFIAYGTALNRALSRLEQRADDLLELPIGGTATGTGANAHPRFREGVLKHLTELSGLKFRTACDSFEALQSRSQLGAYSSALKELALELIRIANDLRMLGSGPTTGLAEVNLPPVQPGSSIMPGKVNPVMAECLDMVAFQVVGSDVTVSLAVQAGQLELNVMTPVIIHNILSSMKLLTNYLPVFTERCVSEITINKETCRSYVDQNPALATLLNPIIGYLKAAELAKESLEKGIPVRSLVVERGVITEEQAEEIFDIKKIAKGNYQVSK